MKKMFYLLLVFISLFGLVGCKQKEKISLYEEVKILTPGGIPYLGIGNLLGTQNLVIEQVSGADLLKASLIKGDYDIVIAPINLGAQLYSKGNSKFQLAAGLTKNNAYIVSNNDLKLSDIADLKDKEIIAFGETGIPGALLKKIYTDNNLNLDNIDFTSASSQAAMQLWLSNQDKYVLLSEPEISKLVVEKKFELKTLDLTAVFKLTIPQACIFVNPNANQQLIDRTLKLIENNVSFLNENPNRYAEEVIGKSRLFEAMKLDVIKRALPLASVSYLNAKENKQCFIDVLTLLGIGNPNESFYR